MKLRSLKAALALAFLPTISVPAETIFVLSTLDQIVSFDSATPGSILTASSITGLQPGETLVGVDIRPANGLLYGLGSSSRIYTINPGTGAALAVGGGQFSPLLNGTTFSMDFNPTVDRIRVTSDLDQNLRLHPGLGTVAGTDTALAYAAGDSRFGVNPSITAVAYSNNVAGASSTFLYGIDSLQNTLVSIGSPSPNDGTIRTIGALGFDAARFNGFDISGVTGIAYVTSPAASSDPAANLYILDLATGGATLVGKIGDGDTDILVRGMTVFIPIPEPGTLALLAIGGGFGGLLAWRRRSA